MMSLAGAVELTTPKWQGELGASGIGIEVEVLLPWVPAFPEMSAS